MRHPKAVTAATLIVGFTISTSAWAPPGGNGGGGGGGNGGGGGGGGKAEETDSQALLYDGAAYALHGDGLDGDGDASTSRYQDDTLEGSTDCALVIASRIDKPSGVGFLWTPHPGSSDSCEMIGMNRWFEIEQSWAGNPPIDFNGNGNIDSPESMVYARITLAGLYKPVADVMTEGVDVGVAIGPYRIEYPTTFDVVLEDSGTVEGIGKFDVRTVTLGNAPADICAWPTGKQRGKVICEPQGTIVLPMKVRFTRIPPP